MTDVREVQGVTESAASAASVVRAISDLIDKEIVYNKTGSDFWRGKVKESCDRLSACLVDLIQRPDTPAPSSCSDGLDALGLIEEAVRDKGIFGLGPISPTNEKVLLHNVERARRALTSPAPAPPEAAKVPKAVREMVGTFTSVFDAAEARARWRMEKFPEEALGAEQMDDVRACREWLRTFLAQPSAPTVNWRLDTATRNLALAVLEVDAARTEAEKQHDESAPAIWETVAKIGAEAPATPSAGEGKVPVEVREAVQEMLDEIETEAREDEEAGVWNGEAMEVESKRRISVLRSWLAGQPQPAAAETDEAAVVALERLVLGAMGLGIRDADEIESDAALLRARLGRGK